MTSSKLAARAPSQPAAPLLAQRPGCPRAALALPSDAAVRHASISTCGGER